MFSESEAMGGKVLKTFPDRGFGFIEGDDHESYFFHVYEVARTRERSSPAVFEAMKPGDRVSFFREENEKGPRALRVKPDGGAA